MKRLGCAFSFAHLARSAKTKGSGLPGGTVRAPATAARTDSEPNCTKSSLASRFCASLSGCMAHRLSVRDARQADRLRQDSEQLATNHLVGLDRVQRSQLADFRRGPIENAHALPCRCQPVQWRRIEVNRSIIPTRQQIVCAERPT